jgi:hypothetical protein
VLGTAGRPGTTRAAWSTALLLTVLTAFVPLTWLLGVLLAGVVLAFRGSTLGAADPGLRARVAVAQGVPMVALLPWSAHLFAHPTRFLLEPGPTGPNLSDPARNVWKLLALNPGGPGSGPGWLGAGTVLAGLVGLAVARERLVPTIAWGVALVAYLVALVASRIAVAAPAGGHAAAAWPGVAVAAAQAAVLVAAAAGCRDLRQRIAARDFGLVQPAAGAMVVAALAAPVLAGFAWTWRGAAGPVHLGSAAVVPANVVAESLTSDRPRTLVLRALGSSTAGTAGDPIALSYVLLRGAGPRLGAVDDSMPGPAYASLRALVGDLVSGRGDAQAQRLADFAVRYVQVRAPVPDPLGRALDAIPGLERVNASGGDGLWRLSSPTARITVVGPGNLAPTTLPSGAVSATTSLRPGPPGRVLALAEPSDPHWEAELDGTVLPPVRRVGWAQGWELPTSGGILTVRHVDRLRVVGPVAQGLMLVVMIVLALPGATRRPVEDDGPGPIAPPSPRHAHGDELPGLDVARPVGSARSEHGEAGA